MLPPCPPSPPDGPPRGTNFSRRNATQPFPPLPAFTKISASLTTTVPPSPHSHRHRPLFPILSSRRASRRSAPRSHRPHNRSAQGPSRLLGRNRQHFHRLFLRHDRWKHSCQASQR